jgi:oxygen-independent coproporphyrinogen-3 oxidase
VASLFDYGREVTQLHLGGGTPNFLSSTTLGLLLAGIGEHFWLSHRDQRDFSIEIDPRFIEPGYMRMAARFGLNRVSLGVQDFDPEVQNAINRLQSVAQTQRVIDESREAGIRSVNLDLICGLPRQTQTGFARTLDHVLTMRPERVALYSYAHHPELFKAQRQIVPSDLPDAAGRIALQRLAIEALTSSGYEYIGMDHFALPEDDLARAHKNGRLHRNFMGYTTHADCDLIGLGVSAISSIGESFSQNPRSLVDWRHALEQGRIPTWRGIELTPDDTLRRDVIQRIMCQGEIAVTEIERKYGIAFEDYFAQSMARMTSLVADGLVTIDPGHIRATPSGRLFLRNIAYCFDRYA